ncbi:unnamed protein product [Meloidogyne enterolobii]|uniref:Uncharacterized protein n=1 Tax=Meloidogyne enterolobii TaxID=390850 RepID=A0ACB0YKT1_MELEN
MKKNTNPHHFLFCFTHTPPHFPSPFLLLFLSNGTSTTTTSCPHQYHTPPNF